MEGTGSEERRKDLRQAGTPILNDSTTLLRESTTKYDSCLWEESIEKAFFSTCRYMEKCSKAGIVFNPKKFVFARDDVDFAGFTVTKDAIKPTKAMLEAIRDFPRPTTLTGARSWFGLINQVSYAFAQTDVMGPFRDLLKRNKKFYWDATLEKLFVESKEEIIRQIEDGVKNFEVGRPTCLSTDWCKIGLGFCLLQKYCQCDLMDGPNCGGGH